MQATHLDLLHGRLRDDGLLDDGVGVHLVLLRHRLALVLGLASELESVGAEEVSLGVNLTHSLLLNTLNLLGSGSSYTMCETVFNGKQIPSRIVFSYLEYS